MKPQERRRAVRSLWNRRATYRTGAGSGGCLITDISAGGARLHSADVMPEQFTLLIQAGELESRQCRVVWRLGEEVGVQFMGRP
jgi:hypothetical protein